MDENQLDARIVQPVGRIRWLAAAPPQQAPCGIDVRLGPRSAKKSAVRIADSFSATAVLTNWLMLVPSRRLTSLTACFRDDGIRRG